MYCFITDQIISTDPLLPMAAQLSRIEQERIVSVLQED